MNARKKIGILIVLGAVLGAGIVSLVACRGLGWQLIGLYFMERGAREARQQRVRLLARTDHQAVLDAGREILRQLPQGYLGSDDGFHRVGDRPIPEGVGIPQAIRDLGPRGIRVSYDGYLALDMHGGMDHFGFLIYPEGFEKSHPESVRGPRKIIEGLYYYDEMYEYDPNYDNVIDAILQKAGQRAGSHPE
jgi:hypothetical protein